MIDDEHLNNLQPQKTEYVYIYISQSKKRSKAGSILLTLQLTILMMRVLLIAQQKQYTYFRNSINRIQRIIQVI